MIKFNNDKFIIMAPNTNINSAERLIKRNEDHFKQKSSFHFKGVSIGYAVGEVKHQDDFKESYNITNEMIKRNKKRSKKEGVSE